jgi:hypothetical protein
VRPVAPDEIGLSASEFVLPPWPRDQVSHLNRRQGAGRSKPYVCPRHLSVPMFATRWGWVCAVVVRKGEPCGQRQDWTRTSDLTTW